MCTLSCSVKTVSLLSCLLAAAVIVAGGLLLKTSYEKRDEFASKVVGGFESGINYGKNLFGNSDKDTIQYGSERYYKILLSVTAVSIAAAALQLLTSLFLLLCATSKGGRISAKIWVAVNLLTILAIAASVGCVVFHEAFRKAAEDDKELLAYLAASVADVVFLFLFMFINTAFSCRSSS